MSDTKEKTAQCANCVYGRWAPKEYMSCYICTNPDSKRFMFRLDGYEPIECKESIEKSHE